MPAVFGFGGFGLEPEALNLGLGFTLGFKRLGFPETLNPKP